jgi:hypothetical protein
MVNGLLGGSFSPSIALSARDSRWDADPCAVTTLVEIWNSSFLSKMTSRGMDFLLPEIMKAAKENTASGGKRTGKKTFSDEARKHVAESYNLKNKCGLNVTPADQASNCGDSSIHLNGEASNRSFTTNDKQAKMPELHLQLNSLKDRLAELSVNDPLFDNPIMKNTDIEELSASSSPDDAINAIFKDTKPCITMPPPHTGKWKRRAFLR